MAKKKTTEDEEKTVTVRGMGDNGDGEVSGKRLKGFIVDIEKTNAKKEQILQELREKYADAKAVGFDGKTIRAIIRERAMEPEKRREQNELLRLYKDALGMLDDEE